MLRNYFLALCIIKVTKYNEGVILFLINQSKIQSIENVTENLVITSSSRYLIVIPDKLDIPVNFL